MRRALLLLAVVLCPALAGAQTTSFVVPPGSLMPPVLVFPSSAVNGSGTVSTSCFTFPLGTKVCETAADQIDQYRGTNPQTFDVFGTRADGSNFETLQLFADSTAAHVRAVKLGTGTQRPLNLGVAQDDWSITTGHNLVAVNAGTSVVASIHGAGSSSVLSVSSNIIAPTNAVHHVGAGLIKTITVPASCTVTCWVFLVPDAAFTYDATGNITVASGSGTAVVNRLMTAAWDGSKWTMSY